MEGISRGISRVARNVKKKRGGNKFFVLRLMCCYGSEPRVYRRRPLYLRMVGARLRTFYPP